MLLSLQEGLAGFQAKPQSSSKCAWNAFEGGKKLSPHALRHSYALAALRQGGNVVAVSKLLGHSQVTTTMKYLDHLELGELRKAVPKVRA